MQEAEREHLLQGAQTRSAELLEARQGLESKIERCTIALRHLSSKLIHVQDDEPRRIARELHHTIGQYLAALGMSLSKLGDGNASDFPGMLSECWFSHEEKCAVRIAIMNLSRKRLPQVLPSRREKLC